MKGLIESILQAKTASGLVVTIYRDEKSLDRDFDNSDLISLIEDYDDFSISECADIMSKADRVNVIEVKCPKTGEGIRIDMI
jgi:hypothetical protein